MTTCGRISLGEQSSFNAAQSLDGSIPAPPGLAAIQFCTLYVTFGLLCISAPKAISFTGPKWGIALGMVAYVSLVASFLAPPHCTDASPARSSIDGGDGGGGGAAPCWSVGTIWALRLGTAVLVGFGASLVWTGQGVYLGRLAAHAATAEDAADGQSSSIRDAPPAASTFGASQRGQAPPPPLNCAPQHAATLGAEAARRERLGATLKRYNGVFWSCFQFSGACGLVVSSLVLTLVRSSSAVTYLFLGLTAVAIGGVAAVIFFLPSLPPLAAAASAPFPSASSCEAAAAADGGDATTPPSAAGDSAGGGAAADAVEAQKAVSVLAALHLCAEARLALVVPNIVYNGLSLAFVWFMYNTFLLNAAFGTSFVGFGSACFYLVNACATAIASRVAARHGQRRTMLAATCLQLGFYALMLWYQVKPVQCLPSGCLRGTAGSCWRLLNDTSANALQGAPFPIGCTGSALGSALGFALGSALDSACAQCAPFSAAGGQQCAIGWQQCDWLRGDAVPPEASDVAFLLGAVSLFAVGDSVWESQIPAVLQTLFDETSGQQPAAMANLKLWQSLGIGAMYALARLSDVKLCVLICLVSLLLSSASLLWLDARVARLDSGILIA